MSSAHNWLVAAARPGETFHHEAKTLLQQLMCEQAILYLPVIALPEVAAAISRGAGDEQLALQVVGEYRKLPQLLQVDVEDKLGRRAVEVAAKYRFRGCDAIYVALADLQHAVLVTLDRQQRERASSAVSACAPGELLAMRTTADRSSDTAET